MQAYFTYFVAFLAMSCYALLAPIAKKIVGEGITGFQLIFLNSVLLGIFGLISIYVSGKDLMAFKQMPVNIWAWSILWAFLNFLGFALYLYVIDRIPVVNYQILFLAMPIIGGFFAYVLLSEPVSLRQLIGGLIVAFGVYIAIKK